MNKEVRHFSLRKLSVGLASVLVGVSIFGASQTVKADTVADQTASSVTNNMQSSDTQKNKNVAESSFSNDDQADNAKSKTTQTQENEPKQVQAENVRQDSAPKTQEVNDGSDLGAEKSATRASSLQESDNHAQDNSQTQTSQKLDLTKTSPKFNRKVLATNLIETTSSPTTNGGFDEATWGKLDVNNWYGHVQDGVYQLTGYTGDKIHIIVPNEADFEKAGKSTNGLQVGIDCDTAKSLDSYHDQVQTIAFSKTNNQKVKAIGTDWSQAFAFTPTLSKLDGSNLDVSNVTNMSEMFSYNKISDLTSLANWDTSKVTNMYAMFQGSPISDLTPLAHWNTSKVTDMGGMFWKNKVSDLTPLANWDTSKVTNMSGMFEQNSISNLTGLAKWDTNNVTDMSGMFSYNSINDLTSLANWDIGKVTDMSSMFDSNLINDLTPLANWDVSNVKSMFHMFSNNQISNLTGLANWKTGNVTGMSGMFSSNSISDLTPLKNWDTSKVTDMGDMFSNNKISNLTGLAKWDTSEVTDMSGMFGGNQISNLSPLASWDTSEVTDMNGMFGGNQISNLSPLASWNTGKVTSMIYMFANNPDLIDLKPIANWNMNSLSDWGLGGLFLGNTKLDLTNINNTPLMQMLLKKGYMLQGSTFIINNVDFVTRLVKGTTGKDAPILTNTATRTIVFNIPHAAPETIVQTINYRAIAPVQVEWPAPPKSSGGDVSVSEIALAFASRGMGTLVPYDPNNPNHVTPDSPNPVDPDSDNPYIPKIIKTYPVKASDWQLDTSQHNDAIIVNGQIRFASVKIPHVNGYKAYIVPNKSNLALFTVSFVAVPTENKSSTPVEVTPSKPSAPTDNTNKPIAPVDNANKLADDLKQHAITESNSDDSSWTMPTDVSNSTYTVEVPDNNTINLSDLVIAEPVHARTRTQIHINKRFKLSKKRVVKHLKHRKKATKSFKKYRL